MKKNNKREFTIMEKSIGIGVMTGTIVGVLTDNIGLWASFRNSFRSCNWNYTKKY
jgi:hypothetical protein